MTTTMMTGVRPRLRALVGTSQTVPVSRPSLGTSKESPACPLGRPWPAGATNTALMNASPAAVGAGRDVPGPPGGSGSPLPASLDQLWDRRGELGPGDAEARAVVTAAVDALDLGEATVGGPDPPGGARLGRPAQPA